MRLNAWDYALRLAWRVLCSSQPSKREDSDTHVACSNLCKFEQATCVSESGMERGYKKFPDVVGEEDRSLRESDF